ncbi:MAG: ribosome small subunit-dependent GTPase A [Chitinophagaceae bacterium]
MKAIIYKSTGSWYLAKTENGDWMQCRIRGKLKLDDEITSTNPVAVGDAVEIEPEDEQIASIVAVRKRNNYFVRNSPHGRFQKHIVAANIDQVLLMATLKEPRTSTGFMDRILITAEAYHIPVTILFNKRDQFLPKDDEKFEGLRQMYTSMGYSVLLTSILNGNGPDQILEWLTGKTTLLTGHSGVGKSTLINYLQPNLDLRIREVSDWSGKGMHTTTFAEMYALSFGGCLIDTPGIRELGIVDMKPSELSHYFIDMKPFLTECHYNNCLHTEEPGCQVKRAVDEGKIHPERYISYLKILGSLQNEKY